MFKLKSKEEHSALPAPVALTPDELTEMARVTAGGLSLTSAALFTRAGPYPPFNYMNPVANIGPAVNVIIAQ